MGEITLHIPDLLGHQRAVFDGRDRFNILNCGRRWGKALAIDTEIFTYDKGWIFIGVIECGDVVVGGDGKPCKVLNVTPVHEGEYFELDWSGTIIRACKDHLWDLDIVGVMRTADMIELYRSGHVILTTGCLSGVELLGYRYIGRQQGLCITVDSSDHTYCVTRSFIKTHNTVLAKNLLLGVDEVSNGAMNGYPVAYCAPTYKMMNKVWREVKEMISPIIESKSEQDKWIRVNVGTETVGGWVQDGDGKMQGGGVIEFWSLDNIDSIRGNAYRRVIIDEARYVSDLENAWTKSIRPLLSDYEGDFWGLSTPDGMGNYFYEMYKFGQHVDGWRSWKLPTMQNKTIKASEIREAKETLPTGVFSQEYEAEFVSDGGLKWLYTFDEGRHVEEDLPYLKTFPVYLSFDFNANPVSCVAIQRGTNKFLHIFKEFSGDMQLDELCKVIRSYFKGSILFVTGDASGNRHDVGFSGRNQTYYTIIREYLGISERQFNLNKKNLLHNDSRMLCNTMFNSYPGLKISEKGCPKLLNDIRIAEVDTVSGVAGRLKKDRGRFKMDLFDAMRYHFQTYDLRLINKYLKTHELVDSV